MKNCLILLFLVLICQKTTAQLSFNVFPNEQFETYYYIWSNNQPGNGTPAIIEWAAPNPPATWLTGVDPMSFVTDDCMDVILIRFKLQAPAQNGFYSTTLIDQAGPLLSNVSISLSVGNNVPTADTTINFTAATGDTIVYLYPLTPELPANLMGCTGMSYSPIDSMQQFTFYSPQNGTWLSFPSDTLDVGPGETHYLPITLQAGAPGVYEAYFTRYREFRTLPYRTRIRLSVETVGTEEKAAPNVEASGPYPNPASESFAFDIRSKQNREARAEVFDWFGRKVSGVEFQLVEQGSQTIVCPVSHLNPGIYRYQLVLSDGRSFKCGNITIAR